MVVVSFCPLSWQNLKKNGEIWYTIKILLTRCHCCRWSGYLHSFTLDIWKKRVHFFNTWKTNNHHVRGKNPSRKFTWHTSLLHDMQNIRWNHLSMITWICWVIQVWSSLDDYMDIIGLASRFSGVFSSVQERQKVFVRMYHVFLLSVRVRLRMSPFENESFQRVLSESVPASPIRVRSESGTSFRLVLKNDFFVIPFGFSVFFYFFDFYFIEVSLLGLLLYFLLFFFWKMSDQSLSAKSVENMGIFGRLLMKCSC